MWQWGALGCLSVGIELAKHPRQFGHVGIIISHYNFDRGLHTALEKLCKKHHIDIASTTEMQGGLSKDLLELTDWTLISGCALHDAHNALLWALHMHIHDGLYVQV